MEKHSIAVINLMKEISRENPDIQLTLKAKLRALGLYNEEFSIQTMIYRERESEIERYKLLEKGEVIKILSDGSVNIVD